MKRLVIALIFNCILIGYAIAQKEGEPALNTLQTYYDDNFSSSVTRNEGKLFAAPDTNSKVIWQHNSPFKAYVTPLLTTDYQGLKWYKVSVENKIEGFLREQDFVKYSFYGINDTYYYVVNEPKPKWPQYYKILRKNKLGVIDTFDLGMHYSYLRAKAAVYEIPLQGVKTVLYFEFFNAQCPGTVQTFLVADVGDSLTTIANSFSQGEGGWSVNTTVYLPVKFGNGKVLLVVNGDVENIFNPSTAELNTFKYNKNIGVPIEELVVIVQENYDEIEADRQDADSYKEPETKRTLYKEEYYRWKGNKLVKIAEK